jgi:hypothetical protein
MQHLIIKAADAEHGEGLYQQAQGDEHEVGVAHHLQHLLFPDELGDQEIKAGSEKQKDY